MGRYKHSGSCSCPNCVYKSRSERPAVQEMIETGSRIDRLYYGKYLPLRERKLLQKLIRTRAVYDDVRTQLLSASDDDEKDQEDDSTERSSAVVKIVDLVDRGRIGHKNASRLSSCCNCCSCSSFKKLRDDDHPRVHRHNVPHDAIAKYTNEAERRGRAHRRKISTKLSTKFRTAKHKAKHIRSDPCICTFKFSNMIHRSSWIAKRLKDKKVGKHTEAKNVRIESKAYKFKKCFCKFKLGKHKKPKIGEQKVRVKKDSILLYREKIKKERSLKKWACKKGVCVPDECVPEECLEKNKVVFKDDKRKHRSSGTELKQAHTSMLTLPKRTSSVKIQHDGLYKTKSKTKTVCECPPTALSTIEPSASKQAVRIGSSFSFNIEFYKEKIPSTENVEKTIESEKGQRISQSHRRHTASQSLSFQPEPDAQRGFELKRCLCALKILKKKKTYLRRSISKKTMTAAYTKDVKMADKVKQTQCKCPIPPLHIVYDKSLTKKSFREKRTMRHSSLQTTKLSRKPHTHEDSQIYPKNDDNFEKNTKSEESPQRQVVRIGSSYSFNVDFSKERITDKAGSNEKQIHNDPNILTSVHRGGIKVHKPGQAISIKQALSKSEKMSHHPKKHRTNHKNNSKSRIICDCPPTNHGYEEIESSLSKQAVRVGSTFSFHIEFSKENVRSPEMNDDITEREENGETKTIRTSHSQTFQSDVDKRKRFNISRCLCVLKKPKKRTLSRTFSKKSMTAISNENVKVTDEVKQTQCACPIPPSNIVRDTSVSKTIKSYKPSLQESALSKKIQYSIREPTKMYHKYVEDSDEIPKMEVSPQRQVVRVGSSYSFNIDFYKNKISKEAGSHEKQTDNDGADVESTLHTGIKCQKPSLRHSITKETRSKSGLMMNHPKKKASNVKNHRSKSKNNSRARIICVCPPTKHGSEEIASNPSKQAVRVGSTFSFHIEFSKENLRSPGMNDDIFKRKDKRQSVHTSQAQSKVDKQKGFSIGRCLCILKKPKKRTLSRAFTKKTMTPVSDENVKVTDKVKHTQCACPIPPSNIVRDTSVSKTIKSYKPSLQESGLSKKTQYSIREPTKVYHKNVEDSDEIPKMEDSPHRQVVRVGSSYSFNIDFYKNKISRETGPHEKRTDNDGAHVASALHSGIRVQKPSLRHSIAKETRSKSGLVMSYPKKKSSHLKKHSKAGIICGCPPSDHGSQEIVSNPSKQAVRVGSTFSFHIEFSKDKLRSPEMKDDIDEREEKRQTQTDRTSRAKSLQSNVYKQKGFNIARCLCFLKKPKKRTLSRTFSKKTMTPVSDENVKVTDEVKQTQCACPIPPSNIVRDTSVSKTIKSYKPSLQESALSKKTQYSIRERTKMYHKNVEDSDEIPKMEVSPQRQVVRVGSSYSFNIDFYKNKVSREAGPHEKRTDNDGADVASALHSGIRVQKPSLRHSIAKETRSKSGLVMSYPKKKSSHLKKHSKPRIICGCPPSDHGSQEIVSNPSKQAVRVGSTFSFHIEFSKENLRSPEMNDDIVEREEKIPTQTVRTSREKSFQSNVDKRKGFNIARCLCILQKSKNRTLKNVKAIEEVKQTQCACPIPPSNIVRDSSVSKTTKSYKPHTSVLSKKTQYSTRDRKNNKSDEHSERMPKLDKYFQSPQRQMVRIGSSYSFNVDVLKNNISGEAGSREKEVNNDGTVEAREFHHGVKVPKPSLRHSITKKARSKSGLTNFKQHRSNRKHDSKARIICVCSPSNNHGSEEREIHNSKQAVRVGSTFSFHIEFSKEKLRSPEINDKNGRSEEIRRMHTIRTSQSQSFESKADTRKRFKIARCCCIFKKPKKSRTISKKTMTTVLKKNSTVKDKVKEIQCTCPIPSSNIVRDTSVSRTIKSYKRHRATHSSSLQIRALSKKIQVRESSKIHKNVKDSKEEVQNSKEYFPIPRHQVVCIGSSFSFNVEFSKERIPNEAGSDENQRKKRHIRKSAHRDNINFKPGLPLTTLEINRMSESKRSYIQSGLSTTHPKKRGSNVKTRSNKRNNSNALVICGCPPTSNVTQEIDYNTSKKAARVGSTFSFNIKFSQEMPQSHELSKNMRTLYISQEEQKDRKRHRLSSSQFFLLRSNADKPLKKPMSKKTMTSVYGRDVKVVGRLKQIQCMCPRLPVNIVHETLRVETTNSYKAKKTNYPSSLQARKYSRKTQLFNTRNSIMQHTDYDEMLEREPYTQKEESVRIRTNKQAVRIGSTFNFNIDFYKENPQVLDIIENNAANKEMRTLYKNENQYLSIQSSARKPRGSNFKRCVCALKSFRKWKSNVSKSISKKTMTASHLSDVKEVGRIKQIQCTCPVPVSNLVHDASSYKTGRTMHPSSLEASTLTERQRSVRGSSAELKSNKTQCSCPVPASNLVHHAKLSKTTKSYKSRRTMYPSSLQGSTLTEKRLNGKESSSADLKSYTSKQAVRIGSTFSFNIEFYKENINRPKTKDEIVDNDESIKSGETQRRRTASQMRSYQSNTETRRKFDLKRCLCSLKIPNKRKQSLDKRVSKKTMTSAYSKHVEVASRVKLTQCKCPVPPSNIVHNTPLLNTKKSSYKAKRSMHSSASQARPLSRKTQYTTLERAKKYSKHVEDFEVGIPNSEETHRSPPRQAVRIGSSFSFNIEFSKETIPPDGRSKLKQIEYNDRSVQKSVRQTGIKVHKPSLRHTSSQTIKTEKSKQTHTKHKLVRCLCTLDLLKEQSTRTTFQREESEIIMRSKLSGTEMSEREYQRSHLNSIDQGTKSVYSRISKSRKSSKGQHHMKRRKTIPKNKAPRRPTKQAVRIGSSFSFNIDFYKDKKINDTAQDTYNRKVRYSHSPPAAEKRRSEKGNSVRSAMKRCLCILNFHKGNNTHERPKVSRKVVRVGSKYDCNIDFSKQSSQGRKHSKSLEEQENKNYKSEYTMANKRKTKHSVALTAAYCHVIRDNDFLKLNSNVWNMKNKRCKVKEKVTKTITGKQQNEKRMFNGPLLKYKNVMNSSTSSLSIDIPTHKKELVEMPYRCMPFKGRGYSYERDGLSCIQNPFRQSLFLLNMRVSDTKKQGSSEKSQVLDKYECKPGICVPYECDPMQCLKLNRKIRSMASGTEHHSTKSGKSITRSKKNSKTTETHISQRELSHLQTLSQSINSKMSRETKVKHVSESTRQAVRLGSSLSFDIEFYKQNKPTDGIDIKPDFSGLQEQGQVKVKRKSTKSSKEKSPRGVSKGRTKDNSLTGDTGVSKGKTSTQVKLDIEDKGIGTMIKRCFCNLKLRNKSKNYELSQTKKISTKDTMIDKPFGNIMLSENKTINTDKLEPYECAPGDCIPDDCDPKECYKLKQRLKLCQEQCVGTNCKIKCLSKDFNTISKTKSAKSVKPCKCLEKRRSSVSPPPRLTKQSVRFGSSVSFSVEFFCDRPTSSETESNRKSTKNKSQDIKSGSKVGQKVSAAQDKRLSQNTSKTIKSLQDTSKTRNKSVGTKGGRLSKIETYDPAKISKLQGDNQALKGNKLKNKTMKPIIVHESSAAKQKDNLKKSEKLPEMADKKRMSVMQKVISLSRKSEENPKSAKPETSNMKQKNNQNEKGLSNKNVENPKSAKPTTPPEASNIKQKGNPNEKGLSNKNVENPKSAKPTTLPEASNTKQKGNPNEKGLSNKNVEDPKSAKPTTLPVASNVKQKGNPNEKGLSNKNVEKPKSAKPTTLAEASNIKHKGDQNEGIQLSDMANKKPTSIMKKPIPLSRKSADNAKPIVTTETSNIKDKSNKSKEISKNTDDRTSVMKQIKSLSRKSQEKGKTGIGEDTLTTCKSCDLQRPKSEQDDMETIMPYSKKSFKKHASNATLKSITLLKKVKPCVVLGEVVCPTCKRNEEARAEQQKKAEPCQLNCNNLLARVRKYARSKVCDTLDAKQGQLLGAGDLNPTKEVINLSRVTQKTHTLNFSRKAVDSYLQKQDGNLLDANEDLVKSKQKKKSINISRQDGDKIEQKLDENPTDRKLNLTRSSRKGYTLSISRKGGDKPVAMQPIAVQDNPTELVNIGPSKQKRYSLNISRKDVHINEPKLNEIAVEGNMNRSISKGKRYSLNTTHKLGVKTDQELEKNPTGEKVTLTKSRRKGSLNTSPQDEDKLEKNIDESPTGEKLNVAKSEQKGKSSILPRKEENTPELMPVAKDPSSKYPCTCSEHDIKMKSSVKKCPMCKHSIKKQPCKLSSCTDKLKIKMKRKLCQLLTSQVKIPKEKKKKKKKKKSGMSLSSTSSDTEDHQGPPVVEEEAPPIIPLFEMKVNIDDMSVMNKDLMKKKVRKYAKYAPDELPPSFDMIIERNDARIINKEAIKENVLKLDEFIVKKGVKCTCGIDTGPAKRKKKKKGRNTCVCDPLGFHSRTCQCCYCKNKAAAAKLKEIGSGSRILLQLKHGKDCKCCYCSRKVEGPEPPPEPVTPLFEMQVNKEDMSVLNQDEIIERIRAMKDIPTEEISPKFDLLIEKSHKRIMNETDIRRYVIEPNTLIKEAKKKAPPLPKPKGQDVIGLAIHPKGCTCCLCVKRGWRSLPLIRKRLGLYHKKPVFKKPRPCVCGSEECKKDKEVVDTKMRRLQRETHLKEKPCTCGSHICRAEVEKEVIGGRKIHITDVTTKLKKFFGLYKQLSYNTCKQYAKKKRKFKEVMLTVEEEQDRVRDEMEKEKELIKKERQKRALENKKKAQMRAKYDPEYKLRMKMQKIQAIRDEKARLKRAKLYKIEDAARSKRRNIENNKAYKGIKKSKGSDYLLCRDSLIDLGKLIADASCSLLRTTCRSVRDPKTMRENFKTLITNPKLLKETMETSMLKNELGPAASRITKRIGSMDSTKQVVKKLESYPVTNFMIHFADKDPRKRIHKVGPVKRVREPLDFQCSLYMASLRKRPHWAVYFTCPWFYPHWLGILRVWQQIKELAILLMAVVVWTPCVFCMEFCRAFMCCCFCTG